MRQPKRPGGYYNAFAYLFGEWRIKSKRRHGNTPFPERSDDIWGPSNRLETSYVVFAGEVEAFDAGKWRKNEKFKELRKALMLNQNDAINPQKNQEYVRMVVEVE